MKILNTIGPVLNTEARQMLASIGTVVDFNGKSAELAQCISDYDIVLAGLGFRFDQEILSQANKLKLLAVATTGLDHIDLTYANERGISVISLKGEEVFLRTITSTAELAFGLMIDLMRSLSAAFDSVKEGQWNRERFRGHSLSRQTLGIVGLGRLGTLMAGYALAFKMTAIAYSPYSEKKIFSNLGVRAVDFATLLQESDVISLHVPLTDETKTMFKTSTFEKMKSSAYLINTSRGSIVDETALLAALQEGQIAGYATDVLSDETNFSECDCSSSPLVTYSKTHNNVIITPHIGGMTQESRAATDIYLAQMIVKRIKLF